MLSRRSALLNQGVWERNGMKRIGNGVGPVSDARDQHAHDHDETACHDPFRLFHAHRVDETEGIGENTNPPFDAAVLFRGGCERLIRTLCSIQDMVLPLQPAVRHGATPLSVGCPLCAAICSWLAFFFAFYRDLRVRFTGNATSVQVPMSSPTQPAHASPGAADGSGRVAGTWR
jgi:hypothetical protein